VVHAPQPPIPAALDMVQHIPDDIRTLRQAGITQAEMQRVLGVHRFSLNRYEKGKCRPRHPIVFAVLHLWAEQVRQRSQS